MKKFLYAAAMTLLIMLGVGLLAYPVFANWWNMRGFDSTIRQYAASISSRSSREAERLMQEAHAYNERLAQIGNRFFPLTPEETEEYDRQLSATGSRMSMMGYITIPSINVSLPIYHTTDNAVLSIGVGHLEGTSLPVGGPGTHCVLSGHTGLSNAMLFTDLDQLKQGDQFFLHVLSEVRTYEVDQIKVVLPHEVENLMIEPGMDLCTLVTCTPYGINSHRLLVRGRFVSLKNQNSRAPSIQSDIRMVGKVNVVQYSLLFVVPFVLLALLLITKRR